MSTRSTLRPCAAVLVLLLTFAEAYAASDGATGAAAEVPSTTEVMHIDGLLDEATWEGALSFELKYEVSPADGAPAPVRTEVLLVHDAAALYIAFRAFDPQPASIRARIVEHDSAWRDDRVGVALDTFNDERRSYLFMVNPFGSQMDYVNSPSGDDTGWDAIWDSAGTITDWGWQVELAIPMRNLRFQPTDSPQTWGFNALRYYPRHIPHWLSLIREDRNNDCWQCQFEKIRGFAGVATGRNLELAPTITTSHSEIRDPSLGRFVTGSEETELGVTATWGITPTTTLGAALNPDFSQVEADALQLDVNEPFALFYPEQRPFFTEASDFFQTPINAVHTRSVRDPSWGLKLAGRYGSTTVAAFAAEDELTHLILPASQSSRSATLAGSSLAGVLRLSHHFGDNSAVGLLMTGREGDDYANQVAGLDGDLRLTASDRLTVQVLASSTSYPDALAGQQQPRSGDLDDLAARFTYNHAGRNLSWWAGYDHLGADFRADLGWMPQVGYAEGRAGIGYSWIAEPGRWWSTARLGASFNRAELPGGTLLREISTLSGSYSGAYQSALQAELSRSRELFNGVLFRQQAISLWGELWPTGSLQVSLGVVTGDRIDYANTRAGRRLRLNPRLSWRAGRRLQLVADHTFEQMKVDQGRLYTANISYLSATYGFSLHCSVRAILQYLDYRYAPDLYTVARSARDRRLYSQLLFSYQLNPRTVLFVGYSDSHAAGPHESLRQQQRSLFLKLGYAWLL